MRPARRWTRWRAACHPFGLRDHGALIASRLALRQVNGAVAQSQSTDVVALLRVGHKLSTDISALGLVVDVPGTLKSLHLPIAALDSCRIVKTTSSAWKFCDVCRPQRHILIDFPQQRVFHDKSLSKIVSVVVP
jgi:hypothetical protein